MRAETPFHDPIALDREGGDPGWLVDTSTVKRIPVELVETVYPCTTNTVVSGTRTDSLFAGFTTCTTVPFVVTTPLQNVYIYRRCWSIYMTIDIKNKMNKNIITAASSYVDT